MDIKATACVHQGSKASFCEISAVWNTSVCNSSICFRNTACPRTAHPSYLSTALPWPMSLNAEMEFLSNVLSPKVTLTALSWRWWVISKNVCAHTDACDAWNWSGCSFSSPCTLHLLLLENYFAFSVTDFEVDCLHFHDDYYQLFVYCCIPFPTQDSIIFMKTSVSESASKLYQRNLKTVSQVIIIIIWGQEKTGLFSDTLFDLAAVWLTSNWRFVATLNA